MASIAGWSPEGAGPIRTHGRSTTPSLPDSGVNVYRADGWSGSPTAHLKVSQSEYLVTVQGGLPVADRWVLMRPVKRAPSAGPASTHSAPLELAGEAGGEIDVGDQ